MSFKNSEGAQWSEPQSSGAAVGVVVAYLVEVQPNVFKLTTDRTEATAYWWDNYSGGYLVRRSAEMEPAFLSPGFAIYEQPTAVPTRGDLKLYRRAGAEFLAGASSPKRIAYYGAMTFVVENL